eukprot:scaffold5688_cov104-Cylindrotheca_fusiformis.AAC.9
MCHIHFDINGSILRSSKEITAYCEFNSLTLQECQTCSPLLSASNDRDAIEAQSEIARLRTQVKQFVAIEIIRKEREDADWYGGTDDEVTVYAAGSYDKGAPALNDPIEWKVDLHTVTTCRLADLGSCCLCVGGGFTIANFASNVSESWLDEEDDGTENKIVSFCCEPATWITFSIRGWPRRNWEFVNDSEQTLTYLVEDVARSFPDATVEFRSLSFKADAVHAVFQRMLPPERRAEVRARRPPESSSEFYAGRAELVARELFSMLREENEDD